MARHFLLALPTPPSARLGVLVDDLRTWAPGLRAEPPNTWHIHLRRLPGRPGRILGRLRRSLATAHPVPCLVQGLGSGPEPRKARTVWANIEAPGLDDLRNRLMVDCRLGDTQAWPPACGRVPLAHLPRPVDLRSFLDAHRERPFSFGRIDRLAVLEARASGGRVHYREVASIPLGRTRTFDTWQPPPGAGMPGEARFGIVRFGPAVGHAPDWVTWRAPPGAA